LFFKNSLQEIFISSIFKEQSTSMLQNMLSKKDKKKANSSFMQSKSNDICSGRPFCRTISVNVARYFNSTI